MPVPEYESVQQHGENQVHQQVAGGTSLQMWIQKWKKPKELVWQLWPAASGKDQVVKLSSDKVWDSDAIKLVKVSLKGSGLFMIYLDSFDYACFEEYVGRKWKDAWAIMSFCTNW